MKNVHTLHANAKESTATTREMTTEDLVETLSHYPARDLALLLVEASKAKYSSRPIGRLDEYQKKILPLAIHGNKQTRERIYRLRLICGLLVTHHESICDE